MRNMRSRSVIPKGFCKHGTKCDPVHLTGRCVRRNNQSHVFISQKPANGFWKNLAMVCRLSVDHPILKAVSIPQILLDAATFQHTKSSLEKTVLIFQGFKGYWRRQRTEPCRELVYFIYGFVTVMGQIRICRFHHTSNSQPSSLSAFSSSVIV